MARLLQPSDPTPFADAGQLAALLPEGVHVLVAEPHHAEATLYPQEQAYLNSRAMQPARAREFRVGRALAREALMRLGILDHPLLPADTREPQWPAGVVGSISHCEGVCAVAVAETSRCAGLGIDVEHIGRVDERIAEVVCTPDERRDVAALPEASRVQRLSVLFSAKESAFKALFPLTRQLLDFQDVSISVSDDAFSARAATSAAPARTIAVLRGRLAVGSHLVATAAWLPAA